MAIVRTILQRTCVAFAVRGYQKSPVANTVQSTTRLFSASDFVPPPPPTSKGTPVYPDIDFEHAGAGVKRNTDPNGVHVINGSSRGIGLQFVKSLMERTKVSLSVRENLDVSKGIVLTRIMKFARDP